MKTIIRKVYSLKLSSEDLLWLWQQKSNLKINLCCEKLCTNANIKVSLVYCHINQKKYLIPLCEEHLNSEKEIEISTYFELIEF